MFHAREGLLELHLSVLRGVGQRYRAPFFEALREYSHKPTGVFHALPISRGKSVTNSHWIREMIDFYGLDIRTSPRRSRRPFTRPTWRTPPHHPTIRSSRHSTSAGGRPLLECYELVQKQVEYAMSLRDAVDHHPLLRKYMRCLTTADLIPREYRPSASTSRCGPG